MKNYYEDDGKIIVFNSISHILPEHGFSLGPERKPGMCVNVCFVGGSVVQLFEYERFVKEFKEWLEFKNGDKVE